MSKNQLRRLPVVKSVKTNVTNTPGFIKSNNQKSNRLRKFKLKKLNCRINKTSKANIRPPYKKKLKIFQRNGFDKIKSIVKSNQGKAKIIKNKFKTQFKKHVTSIRSQISRKKKNKLIGCNYRLITNNHRHHQLTKQSNHNYDINSPYAKHKSNKQNRKIHVTKRKLHSLKLAIDFNGKVFKIKRPQ